MEQLTTSQNKEIKIKQAEAYNKFQDAVFAELYNYVDFSVIDENEDFIWKIINECFANNMSVSDAAKHAASKIK